MLEGPTDYQLSHVYYIVASKRGEATLSIEHNPAGQVLVLPVFPSSAVEEALPLLTPEAAHYAAQWRSFMVQDLDRDALGFCVPGDHLPNGIADESRAAELLAIARGHVDPDDSPEGHAWLSDPELSDPEVKVLRSRSEFYPSNLDDFAHDATLMNEHAIDLLQ